MPMAVREFYKMRFVKKAIIVSGIFCAVNFAYTRTTFNDYIE